MDNETFAQRLALAMSQKQISSASLANELNRAKSTVSNWLNARNTPGIKGLTEISQVIGVSTDYLLGLDNEFMPSKKIEIVEGSKHEDIDIYYQRLTAVFNTAQKQIYFTAKGFSITTFPIMRERALKLLNATESALKRGVEIVRVQTRKTLYVEWANAYAALMSAYPEQLFVFADFNNYPLMIDFTIADYDEDHPFIEILFQQHEQGVTETRDKFTLHLAFFLYGYKNLAEIMHERFVRYTHSLEPLTPEMVKSLGQNT